ncbi:MAG: Sulfur carrier protein FdhD, partial [uncultured Gemmatimonadetes bacterium]
AERSHAGKGSAPGQHGPPPHRARRRLARGGAATLAGRCAGDGGAAGDPRPGRGRCGAPRGGDHAHARGRLRAGRGLPVRRRADRRAGRGARHPLLHRGRAAVQRGERGARAGRAVRSREPGAQLLHDVQLRRLRQGIHRGGDGPGVRAGGGWGDGGCGDARRSPRAAAGGAGRVRADGGPSRGGAVHARWRAGAREGRRGPPQRDGQAGGRRAASGRAAAGATRGAGERADELRAGAEGGPGGRGGAGGRFRPQQPGGRAGGAGGNDARGVRPRAGIQHLHGRRAHRFPCSRKGGRM